MSPASAHKSLSFLVFGGGGKVARYLAQHGVKQGHKVTSVVRNNDHVRDLKSFGATPSILSLEESTVPQLVELLTSNKPDVVVFAAGAGGKGDKSRTRKVDFEGAVKVYDAMEMANVKRLIVVGAIDIRDRSKDVPSWYNEADRKKSDQTFEAIPAYIQAKYDAEVELHQRKSLAFTVVRPGGLTLEPFDAEKDKCVMGKTHLGKTSRELVAHTILAIAQTPGTEGLSIDVMDRSPDQEPAGSVQEQLDKVIEQGLDSWTG